MSHSHSIQFLMVPSSGWTCIYSSAPSFHSNTWHLPPSTFLRSSPDIPRSLAQVDPRPAPGLSYPPDFDILIEVLRGRIFSRPPLHIVTITFKTRRSRRDTNGASMSDCLTWTRGFEHDYPEVPTTIALSAPIKLACALNLTDNGSSNGTATRQSRMRGAKMVIHPFGHGVVSSHPPVPVHPIDSYQTRDWKPQARRTNFRGAHRRVSVD